MSLLFVWTLVAVAHATRAPPVFALNLSAPATSRWNGALSLIDFDDGGWGYRLFDIATALIKSRAEPDYPALQAALIAGYQRERALDVSALDLFMALRAVTYVGWIITRLNEPGGTTRNSRMVAQARALIDGL